MQNFGMPRCGNANFASNFSALLPTSWRMVHEDDLVPHIPPEDFIVHYHHVPTEIWEYEDGVYKVCDASGEDPTCADSVPKWKYSNADHMTYMGVYVNCTY